MLSYDRSGCGPVLVLLHGLGHHREAWHPVLPQLTRCRDVINVDLPGHGRSAPLPSGTIADLDALLDALRGLFAELGLDAPHVAGNSLGGRLALELADSGDASSAVAIAPAGFWADDREYAFLCRSLRRVRMLGRLLEPLAPVVSRLVVTRSLVYGLGRGRPWRMTAAEALEDIRAEQVCAHFDEILTNGLAYRPPFGSPVPVTVAWGTRDLVLPPRHARRARMLLPQARHILLSGCGHVPMADDPDRIADLLLAASAETSDREPLH